MAGRRFSRACRHGDSLCGWGKGSFFEKAVLWAVEEGITTGTDANHFSPGRTCNRATVVTFLHRAFGEPAVESSSNPFQDVPAGGWYTAPILWAVEQNITTGVSAARFAPGLNCRRAQIVTFLFRAYVNLTPKKHGTHLSPVLF